MIIIIKKESVLIVDDDVVAISALKDIINPDYNVYVVKSGEEAIEKAKMLTPDLILLDICMPDMDGYQTINELKSSELTKSIPVIFISGNTESSDIKTGISNGAIDYITKPFDDANVLTKVKEAVEK